MTGLRTILPAACDDLAHMGTPTAQASRILGWQWPGGVFGEVLDVGIGDELGRKGGRQGEEMAQENRLGDLAHLEHIAGEDRFFLSMKYLANDLKME
jgi:hypothetical protein